MHQHHGKTIPLPVLYAFGRAMARAVMSAIIDQGLMAIGSRCARKKKNRVPGFRRHLAETVWGRDREEIMKSVIFDIDCGRQIRVTRAAASCSVLIPRRVWRWRSEWVSDPGRIGRCRGPRRVAVSDEPDSDDRAHPKRLPRANLRSGKTIPEIALQGTGSSSAGAASGFKGFNCNPEG